MIFTKMDNKSKTLMLKTKYLSEYAKGGIERAFDDIGKMMQTRIRRNILNEKKNGLLYKVKKNGKLVLHRASAPGQTGANISGEYYKSIGYERQGSNKLSVGSTVEHGRDLEYGHKKRVSKTLISLPSGTNLKGKKLNVAPRPGIKNAVKESQKFIDEYFYKRIHEFMKR